MENVLHEENSRSKRNYYKPLSIVIAAISVVTFFTLLILTGAPSNSTHAKYDNSPMIVNDSFERFTIVAAGDAMQHMAQLISAYDSASRDYNYNDVFKFLHPVFENTDVAIVNYETTNGGKPYTGYPQFSSPDTLAWFVKNAGFNFFVNANNHAADRGLRGIFGTLNVFDRNKIRHTGVFRDTSERRKTYPYILNEKGFKLALLNYTYGTNGLRVPLPAVINTIDTLRMKKDLQNAADAKPDAIIVMMHWGTEYKREAGPDQVQIANFLFRNGVDVIVGSHPHVVQPIQLYHFNYKGQPKTGLVIWSLGNLVAHQRRRFTNGGIFVRLDIARNYYTGKVKVDHVFYIPFWVYKQLKPLKFFVLPISTFENDSVTFSMHDSDKIAFKTFINDTRLYLARDTAHIKELFLQE